MRIPSPTRGRVVARPGSGRGLRILGDGDRATWIWALALGTAGLGWRIVLLLFDVPPTNSDEATAGLAALHIAQGRDPPVFFYGQHYMGTIQSFLAAPLFALIGPSTLLLRVPPLIAYGLFVFLMYRLTVKTLGPWFGVATVGVLALGSDRLVKNQLIGAGGYAELGPMLAALFLIALGVATNTFKKANLALAAWGLIGGVALWTHWLAAPYVLGAAVVLVVGCRPRLRGVGVLTTVASLMVGASPLLWHNLTAPRDLNSISVFLALNTAGGDPSLGARLFGGALVGIPMATGLCAPGQCDPTRLWWAPVFVVFLGMAAIWSARAFRTTTGPDRVRSLTLFMLAVSALLTIALYVRSPAAGEAPNESARYLHFVLVSTPVWIWALWRVGVGVWGRFGSVSAAVVASAVALTMVLATAELAVRAPTYARWANENRELVALLEARGVSHVYGGYWTCHRIMLETGEGIKCATLGDDLGKGLNRYPAYWDEVRSHSQIPVFITRVEPGVANPESQLDAAVQSLLSDSGKPVSITRAGGYLIYQPSGPVALPLP